MRHGYVHRTSNFRRTFDGPVTAVSHEKKGPWLFMVYRASKTTQLYRDYFINHEIRIPSLTNQDSICGYVYIYQHLLLGCLFWFKKRMSIHHSLGFNSPLDLEVGVAVAMRLDGSKPISQKKTKVRETSPLVVGFIHI